MYTCIVKADRAISHNETFENVSVGIVGDRIAGFVTADATAERTVDLGDCTLLPGFIDAHVHFGPENEGHVFARLHESHDEKMIKSVVDARNLLRAGFTSVRDVGGRRVIALRNCINRAEIEGPRIRCSGRGLTSTGGAEDWPHLPVELVNELSDANQVCNGVDELRRGVRDQYRLGADLIKLFVNGFFEEERYSPEEIHAVMEEARRLRYTVAVHANGGPLLREVIRAGCHTIEHGTYLVEEDAVLMRDQHVTLVPTLAFTRNYAKMGQEYGTPKADPQNRTDRLPRRMESVRLANELGVNIATGTDYGFRGFMRHGKLNFDELDLLAECGLSKMQVLMAATLNAAGAIGMGDAIGSIEEGKYADLVAVGGDPLQELSSVRETRFVMKGGKEVLNLAGE